MARAGTKSAGLAWAIAFGSVVMALLVNILASKVNLPTSVTYGLYVGIVGAAGAMAVYLTRAGAGQGILAFLVASLVMAVGTYVILSMAVSAAASDIAASAGTDGTKITLNQGAADTIGAIAGVVVAVVNLIVTFGAGLTGCLIGSSMKKKAAAADAPALQRMAA
jgi:hypothetical protein